MTAANVTIEGEPAAWVWFDCPKTGDRCGPLLIAGRTSIKRDGQNQNGGRAQWDFSGTTDTATLSPSVNCSGCWHGYIRDGRCVDVAGKDEPERTRT